MGEARILIRLRMYFPRNWKFGSALTKPRIRHYPILCLFEYVEMGCACSELCTSIWCVRVRLNNALAALPDLVPSRVWLEAERYLVQNLVLLFVSVKVKSEKCKPWTIRIQFFLIDEFSTG
jgi:hypothetical protein